MEIDPKKASNQWAGWIDMEDFLDRVGWYENAKADIEAKEEASRNQILEAELKEKLALWNMYISNFREQFRDLYNFFEDIESRFPDNWESRYAEYAGWWRPPYLWMSGYGYQFWSWVRYKWKPWKGMHFSCWAFMPNWLWDTRFLDDKDRHKNGSVSAKVCDVNYMLERMFWSESLERGYGIIDSWILKGMERDGDSKTRIANRQVWITYYNNEFNDNTVIAIPVKEIINVNLKKIAEVLFVSFYSGRPVDRNNIGNLLAIEHKITKEWK